jgi:uncharacterized protein YciI
MQYLVKVLDYENALEKRMAVREKHLEVAREMVKAGQIINAGAILKDEKMIGSTFFMEFDSHDEIDTWLKDEVYILNNVWDMDTFEMLDIKLLVKNL